jgi:hypothetical protein
MSTAYFFSKIIEVNGVFSFLEKLMLVVRFKVLKDKPLWECLMDNRWVAVIVGVVFFVAAFLIQLQQKITFGLWFQISDLHHETFAIACVALGIGIIIGALISENDRKNPRINV